MTRVACLAIVIAVAGVALAADPAADPSESRDGPFPLLKDGPIAVVRIEAPGTGALDVRVQLRIGSAADPPGQEGLTALMARAMAEGATAHGSYADRLTALYPLGATLGVEVAREQVTFTARCHPDHAATVAAMLAQVLTEPAFEQADVDRARDQARAAVVDGLRGGDDEALAKAVLDLAVHGGGAGRRDMDPAAGASAPTGDAPSPGLHPYAHLEEGSIRTLDALTPADLRAWHTRTFTRGAVAVALGGAGVDVAARVLVPALDALPQGHGVLVQVPPAPPLQAPRALLVERDAPATAISIGFPIEVGRGHPDYVPLLVATSWLGEHRQLHGRLFRRMRAARGLNYGDYAYLEHFEQDGHTIRPRTGVARTRQTFSLWIRPVPHESRAFAVKLALWELERLADRGLSQQELDGTRGFLLGTSRVLEETVARRLGNALDARHLGLPPHLETIRRALPAVTVDQVRDAVRRHLRPDGLVIVAVTRDAQAMARELLSPRPTPPGYPPRPALAAEDAEVGASDAGLTARTIRVLAADELFEHPGLPRGAPVR